MANINEAMWPSYLDTWLDTMQKNTDRPLEAERETMAIGPAQNALLFPDLRRCHTGTGRRTDDDSAT